MSSLLSSPILSAAVAIVRHAPCKTSTKATPRLIWSLLSIPLHAFFFLASLLIARLVPSLYIHLAKLVAHHLQHPGTLKELLSRPRSTHITQTK